MTAARLVTCSCLLSLACSTASAASAPAGGPVAGAADQHCTSSGVPVVRAVKLSSCSGGGADAGASPDYGATMFGTTGADDDCKYDVTWSSTPIRLAEDFTVTVTVTSRADGKAVTGAATRIEAFLSDVHPAPSTLPTVTETAPGVYRIDPIRFDRTGRWTMRFHFFDACSEALIDSPHGHAAFWVDVP